ncbi:hypothetical protein BHM03_00061485 [Ensete ventricosum]|uniref:Uncharacterized protein n=1 Tax=Ensete ventricosum TaxID=4639 RepID=A0A426XYF6_ENSVE|nr:hypothetical protein B296_00053532 [Ensete ventricosum]RZS27949.1 hypothetical protein BHM03_00061485 [Ensete ventricosum]
MMYSQHVVVLHTHRWRLDGHPSEVVALNNTVTNIKLSTMLCLPLYCALRQVGRSHLLLRLGVRRIPATSNRRQHLRELQGEGSHAVLVRLVGIAATEALPHLYDAYLYIRKGETKTSSSPWRRMPLLLVEDCSRLRWYTYIPATAVWWRLSPSQEIKQARGV